MLYGSIAIKLIIGFIALLIVMRIMGKKEMSDITPFDFIYTFILGGILEEALYSKNISVLHILFAITLWSVLIYTVEVIVQKVDVLRRPLKGVPDMLIEEGKINLRAIKKNHIEMEQLRSMLRQQGVFSIKDVEYAILEPNGAVSIIQHEPSAAEENTAPRQPKPSIMLIDEGRILEKELTKIGKTKQWLQSELRKLNLSSPERIFYAEWTGQGEFYAKGYDD
ncbi:DUF421 domain-containing protein [Peribacillus sp. SCS-155]|uniref:DUF421 domain-containing protein n=1 Tax=Peribacillus sedimenti TaxID=3115297 RepID=UPI003905CD5A